MCRGDSVRSFPLTHIELLACQYRPHQRKGTTTIRESRSTQHDTVCDYLQQWAMRVGYNLRHTPALVRR